MEFQLFSTRRPAKVTAEEEHLFRRWMGGEDCDALAVEMGTTEDKMLGIVAGIWRRMS